jgi:hypothetical protein
MLDTADVLSHIKHELGGGDLSTELDKFAVINQAGHFLYSMHPWRWITGRPGLLDLRGILSGTTATWTASTGTLTATGAFTNYSFLAGDEILVTFGTGATLGTYKILSRTSANAIVLDGSLSASNLTTGNISWRIDPGTIELPADLRDIISIATTSISNVGGVALISLEDLLEKRARSVSITASTGLYYGAVVFSGSPPVPILEIWPSPSANTTGAFRIVYRSRWAAVTTDSEEIDIPEWTEDLYIQIVRAYAAGYERSKVASLHVRLAEIQASPIFDAARRSDGMVQPKYGILRNGGPTIWRRPIMGTAQVVRLVDPPAI